MIQFILEGMTSIFLAVMLGLIGDMAKTALPTINLSALHFILPNLIPDAYDFILYIFWFILPAMIKTIKNAKKWESVRWGP